MTSVAGDAGCELIGTVLAAFHCSRDRSGVGPPGELQEDTTNKTGVIRLQNLRRGFIMGFPHGHRRETPGKNVSRFGPVASSVRPTR